jgi:hypothetical protein
MAFRRQDIPKTTRAADGGLRRIYPRYAKDAALLPRIELAISYLDGMVGRRRGDLAPDAVIDLFGDPKLARCMVVCLADAYRYRSPTLGEALGGDAAAKLAAAGMRTPAEVRARIYKSTNAGAGGFAAGSERIRVLGAVAAGAGIPSDALDEALHLDAERNHVLIRIGNRPNAVDVLARYNALLTLSLLRHASEVTLVLPDLDGETVRAVCARDDVPVRQLPDGEYRFSGRRGSTGSWSQFGVRLARCVVRVMVLSPRPPRGAAVIHLGDRSLALALDGVAAASVRPKHRAASPVDPNVLNGLLEGISQRRRDGDPSVAGWAVRRANEPLVTADALIMPDLICTRDDVTAPVLVSPTGPCAAAVAAAVAGVEDVHPLVFVDLAPLGAKADDGVEAAVDAVLSSLSHLASRRRGARSTLGVLASEVSERGWVAEQRLGDLLGEETEFATRLTSLTERGEVALVPGVGLCRASLLDELEEASGSDIVDVGSLRDLVGDRIGDGPAADALTLHLIRRARLAPPTPLFERSALLPAG